MSASPTDTSPRRRSRGALIARAGLAVAAAVGLGGWALLDVQRSGDETETVLTVTDAVADTPPSTVAPVVEPPTADADQGRAPRGPTDVDAVPDAAEPAATEPDDGLSDLAALLGPSYSVVPEEIEPRPQPVGITTSSIDVDRFPIRAVGLEDDGQLEVPDETEIGWYRYGATAGRPGATVLAAHVSWNRTTGPFFELGRMEPGDVVDVTLSDGTTRQYEVTERTMYDKNELPRDRIWRNTGPETLVLITCGGDFNPEIRRYRQNIVVYAVPVA